MHLAILGACGHGKVVADAALASSWQAVTFFDDAWPDLTENGPWPVEGDTAALLERLGDFDGVVVGIGNNQIRADKQTQLLDAGASLVSVVHPTSVISSYASIGPGCVLFANSVVNAGASIGSGAIVNTGAVVEHDCQVGDFAHISPNAVLAGGVSVQQRAWVGACASVKQLLTIGQASIVGMGAVVVKDVPAGTTVVGSPAKAIKT
ncbi:acetyltransferase [Marinobacter sp. CHS3-4]|uniref:acetyltransferase n=1 Tax=Marinobacter sp. CHS3-4 TaxID=3045174 RepID=UPI0024B4E546|nr:acetyltransferase [Marinobacter sp. CHS3-4]MDI9244983.1 acetyltransferase [Marinobacter sp. CHS3-4]